MLEVVQVVLDGYFPAPYVVHHLPDRNASVFGGAGERDIPPLLEAVGRILGEEDQD